MKIIVPRVGARLESGDMARYYDSGKLDMLHVCHTKKPTFNKQLDAWTMDFRGRVKIASKKNFQICCDDILNGNQVLMVFGKVSKNHFSLDVRTPLTVGGAFAVALTSFADKLAVT